MGQCAAQTFSNITPQKWSALQAKLAAEHIQLTGDSGQVTQDGYTFTWAYQPGTSALTIQCLDHPWYTSCGMITDRLHHWIDSLG
jgi:hypothetical protein